MGLLIHIDDQLSRRFKECDRSKGVHNGATDASGGYQRPLRAQIRYPQGSKVGVQRSRILAAASDGLSGMSLKLAKERIENRRPGANDVSLTVG